MTSQLIIVANDEQAILTMLYDLVTEEGYRALCAYSGAEAQEVIAREKPDLVILDLQMEHMDTGLSVLKFMRQEPALQHIPAILCSANAAVLESHAQELLTQNCDVLAKPYHIDQLLSIIERRIGRASQ